MTGFDVPCLIGVDGGGTTCRFALLREGLRVEHAGGPANMSTDLDGGIAGLRQGLAMLVAKAGLEEGAVGKAHVYLGLAGVLSPAIAARVAAAIPAGCVRVEDDRAAAAIGALGDGEGTVAGLGTGSFFARHKKGKVTLSGGWGLRVGDEASGGWLGRGLIARVLHVRDGLAAPSPLTREVFAEFGADPAQIVNFSLRAGPADYGSFAPRVFAAAAQGDANALALIREGVDYVERALWAIGWQGKEPLCLTGGLGPRYAGFLPPDMQSALVPPRGTGLDGALVLAARLAGERSEMPRAATR